MSIKIAKRFRERGPLRDARAYDPDSVDKVETREDGKNTIIETVTSVTKEKDGTYSVNLTESKYDTSTDYVADWTFTDGGLESTVTDLFSLIDLGGTIVVASDQVVAEVN